MVPSPSRWFCGATSLFLAALSQNPHHHPPILQVRKLRAAVKMTWPRWTFPSVILPNPRVHPTPAGAGLVALHVRIAGPLTRTFSRTGKKPYLAWWEEAFPGELARGSGAL